MSPSWRRMAAFTVPTLSDDELDDDAIIQAPQKTLFERRKEFNSSTAQVSHSTNEVTAASVPAVYPPAQEKSIEVKPSTSAETEKVVVAKAPAPQAAAAGSSSAYRILVNKKQKGNPVLKCIRNVPWEYDAITADYELGAGTCALYLSVKYHNRFPEYIHSRLKELGKSYNLRILLLQVDTKQQDISHELNQLSRMCILAGCTLILAFSHEEAGRYLEVYKAYENKPPTDIMGKTKSDFLSQATEFFTAVKGVNKTDVTTLLTRFKTVKAIITADVESLSLCPGIGPVKARRLHAAFSTSFLKKSKTASPCKSSQVEQLLDELEEDGLL